MISVNLVTFDYFEQLMLMLGWLINNKLWVLLYDLNLAVLPFVLVMINEFLEAIKEGDEVGNKGALALNRILSSFLVMALVYFMAAVPMYTVSMSPAKVNIERSKACKVKIMGSGEFKESTTINTLGAETAEIPLLWAFVHVVNHGITNAAVASIPCSINYKAVKLEVDLQGIRDPLLKRNLGEFMRACYGHAKHKLYDENESISAKLAMNTDWLGSSYFLKTPGYYDTFRSRRPMPGFPYDESRDKVSSNTGVGKNGYPYCTEWWSAPVVGLRAKIHQQVQPEFWDKFKSVFSRSDAEDFMIRRIISIERLEANGDIPAVVAGLRDLDGGLGQAVKQIAYQVGAVYGGLEEAYPLQAGLDMVKVALPMVQYIIMMVMIISLPVIIVISGYSVTTVITAAFSIFALQFMSFWWELSRFLNSRLVDMLYDSDAAKLDWMVASNITDQLVLQFVEGSLFFVIPVVWVAIMTWTGHKIGTGIGSSIKDAASSSQSAGKSGGRGSQSSVTDKAKSEYDNMKNE